MPAISAALAGALIIEPSSKLVILGIALILLHLGCKKSKHLIFACFFCSLFVAGATFYQKEQTTLTILGETIEKITIRPDTIKVNGDLVSFTAEGNQKYQCRLTVTTPEEQHFWLETTKALELSAVGDLELANTQSNLNGFDYRLYLASQGIAGILTIEDYQIVGSHETFLNIQKLRRDLLLHIDVVFPEKTATYMKSLLLGHRDLNFDEIREIYSGSGLLHLFSLSGLHIQLFLGGIYWCFRRLGLTGRQSLGPLMICGFFLYHLTGGAASVARALLFFLVGRLISVTDYHCSALDHFAISLILLLLLQPYVLFSLGGLLSIMISVVLLYIKELGRRRKLSVWQSALVLQATTLPIVCYSFYTVPLFSGLLGLIFIPFFQYVLLPLMIVLFSMSFFKDNAIFQLLIQCSEGLITQLESLIQVFNHFILPASGVSNGYLLVLVIASLILIEKLQKKNYRLIVPLFLFICLPLYQRDINPWGMAAFIDVGQGDSIFIQAPFGSETVLIDTGGRMGFEREEWQVRQQRPSSEYNVIPFLKSRGLSKIDKLVITHADEDHMGEVLAINQQLTIQSLYIAEGVQKNPKMQAILEKMKKQGTKINLVTAGDQIGEKVKLHVVSPIEEVIGENNDSIVLWTKLAEARFLLTGDLETSGEADLLARYPNIQADVLKVGHHGSKTSTSADFIQQLAPDSAIISCGKDNHFGHPHEEVLAALNDCHIYRTDLSGMIYFTWSFFDEIRLNTVKQE